MVLAWQLIGVWVHKFSFYEPYPASALVPIGDKMRQLMSACHTAGRVWGCTPKTALFGKLKVVQAFEANPLCAKWMTVRRWANVLTGRLLV